MSRKRPKNKRAEEAVPEEILAEGSGPTTDAEALAEAASQAFAGETAGEEVLIEPAPEPDVTAERPKRKRGSRREVVTSDEPEVVFEAAADAPGAPQEEAPVSSTDDAEAPVSSTDDAEAPAAEVAAAPETRKRKRGKRNDEAAADAAVIADAGEPDADADAAIEAAVLEAEELDADAAEPDALDSEVGPELEEAQVEAEQIAAADEQALEDAAMRAEAEAELGSAEAEPESGDEDIELSASLPTTAATMDDTKLKHLLEALIFAADKPLNLQRLRQLTRVSDAKRLEVALEALAVDFADRGIALQVVSGGYQFRTNTGFSQWVQQLIAGRPVRLSRAQLETLAIIAYRQPITRPEIDEIRGVDSAATLRLLMDRSLIRILGKKEDVGRPILYGTTKEFLDFFSLNDLRELPTLREYSELTDESRKVMSERLGISVDASGADAVLEPPPASDEVVDDASLADAMESTLDADALGSDEPGIDADVAPGEVDAIASELEAMSEELDAMAGEDNADTDTRADLMSDADLDRAALEAVAAVDASAMLDVSEGAAAIEGTEVDAAAGPSVIASSDAHAGTGATEDSALLEVAADVDAMEAELVAVAEAEPSAVEEHVDAEAVAAADAHVGMDAADEPAMSADASADDESVAGADAQVGTETVGDTSMLADAAADALDLAASTSSDDGASTDELAAGDGRAISADDETLAVAEPAMEADAEAGVAGEPDMSASGETLAAGDAEELAAGHDAPMGTEGEVENVIAADSELHAETSPESDPDNATPDDSDLAMSRGADHPSEAQDAADSTASDDVTTPEALDSTDEPGAE